MSPEATFQRTWGDVLIANRIQPAWPPGHVDAVTRNSRMTWKTVKLK